MPLTKKTVTLTVRVNKALLNFLSLEVRSRANFFHLVNKEVSFCCLMLMFRTVLF